MNKEKGHMTVKELANYLNCSLYTAYQLTHTEGFPVFRLGRKVLIPVDDFKKWLENNSKGVSSPYKQGGQHERV